MASFFTDSRAAERITTSEIEAIARKMQKSVKDFEKKDRRSLLRAAAGPVRKAVKRKTPVSKYGHTRYSGSKKIKYNPGNLRRSMKVLVFRRSPDVFVGPKWGGKTGSSEYGGVGQPVDGYYYAMAFGSAAFFRRAVLDPAAFEAEDEAIAKIKLKAVKRFQGRAKSNGLATN